MVDITCYQGEAYNSIVFIVFYFWLQNNLTFYLQDNTDVIPTKKLENLKYECL